MSTVANIARHAARRRTWLRVVRLLPLALAAGFAAATLLLAASRFAGIALPAALLVTLPLIIAIFWTGISLWRHQLSLHAAAAALDERANLHDQLATALEFEDHAAPDPFQTLTHRSAESLASQVSLASLFPLRWHGSSLLLPVAIGALITAHWLIPLRDSASAQQVGVRTLPQDTAARAAAALEESRQIVESVQDTYQQVETADQTAALLDDLQEQLAAGETLDESDIARASNALEEAADELDSRAQESRESFEDLQDSLSQLNRPDSQDETSPLRDALARGDYKRAQEEIDRLLEELEMFHVEQSDEADSLRESLDQLQDDLESLSTPDEPTEESFDAPPIPDQSPTADPSPPSEQDSPETTPDQPQAQDASGEPETQPDNPPASEDEPSPQDESTASDPDSAQNDTTEQTTSDSSGSPPDQNQSQSDESPQERSPANQEQQNPDSQSARDRIEQLRKALKRDRSFKPTSTQEQPQEQPSSEPDSSPTDRAKQRDESDQSPQNDPQGEQQDQNPGDKPDSPQQVDKESLERAKELIKRWQEQQEQAQDAQGDAQKLRERAQDLLESIGDEQVEPFRSSSRDDDDGGTSGATPDGSHQGDSAAADFQRDPLTTNTEPVDARQQGAPSQVLAEWFPDRDQPRDERTTQSVATRLRQAAQSARRASDRQSLPPRSRDAVRRYFDRLDELASQKLSPPPPPAEDIAPPTGDR